MELYLYVRHFPAEGDRLHDGIVKAVHGLATGLVAVGAKVTILCESSAIADSSHQTDAGYRIECFANPIQHRPAFRLSESLKFYIANLPHRSRVILNGILHPSIYAMAQLCQQCGVPYIVAPHDVYSPEMFRKNPHLKWVYWYLFEKRTLQQAKAVQLLDLRQEKWLLRLGIQTPCFEIPNGFSPADILPDDSLRWNTQATPRILFFGRLDAHHKGLDRLLDAFRKVVKLTDAQLTLQGPDQGDRTRLQKRARSMVAKNQVIFLEPEYEKSPTAAIAPYDIFCLPSRYEGFGLSALEAMLAGRVLLVSQSAGIAPHVQMSGCGLVVKPEVTAIKSGLLELLQRRGEWRSMGLRGRQYALEQLNWQRIGAKALRQY
ncbi:MAG: glycosyltransferase [Oculatellaceae cyanobacterium Prado106]|jgi:glycosyltransferase involved in cell wall biosynthesis|nr:glycosyltransferase [Oculatellaceae cyanobacterium Prado106]